MVDNLFLQDRIQEKIVSFSFDLDLNGNITFGYSNKTNYVQPLVRNRINVQSPYMWNLNYQGVMYNGQRINERNKTTIFA